MIQAGLTISVEGIENTAEHMTSHKFTVNTSTGMSLVYFGVRKMLTTLIFVFSIG